MIRQNFLILIVTVTYVLFLSCSHNGDWAKRLVWDEIEFVKLPDENIYPDAGAINILDEGQMQIIGSSELPMSLFERHRIVKILNNRGQHYANISIAYTPQSRIENIQARTISPTGKIKVLDKKNIYDVTLYPRFIFYSDQRAKIFTMPAIEPGSVIEYRYQLRISGRNLWPSWNFQDDIPTLNSRFIVVAPSEWEVKHKLYNIDLEATIVKAPSGFKSSYIWQAKDVPAFKSEFGMPPMSDRLARLEIAPLGMTCWDDVAQWYHELSEPQIKAGNSIKELALTLTQNVEGDEAKLKNIYEWVRDQVRYISVAIGIGGFQPHPAEEILDNKYGDCKDMSTLLCALAREIGIEAYEVLVSTWQNGSPDTTLPSPFQFNHAIAYCPEIGDNGVWLDATEKGCSFGDLPWYDQGLPVLVVAKDGKAEIKTTPRTLAESNLMILNWQVDLLETGAAIVHGNTQYRGALAMEMRDALYFASNDDLRQWLETYLAARCAGTQLDSFRVSGLDPVNDPLTINYNFKTRHFALQDTEEMSFRPGQILAFDLPDYFRSPERTLPIQLRYGVHDELKLKINLPEKWGVKMPVWSDSIVSQFGSGKWAYSAKENILEVHLNHLLNGTNIDPKQYRDFQNFLDEIKERDLREIVLIRKII